MAFGNRQLLGSPSKPDVLLFLRATPEELLQGILGRLLSLLRPRNYPTSLPSRNVRTDPSVLQFNLLQKRTPSLPFYDTRTAHNSARKVPSPLQAGLATAPAGGTVHSYEISGFAQMMMFSSRQKDHNRHFSNHFGALKGKKIFIFPAGR